MASKLVNIFFSLALVAVLLLCYALLIILFLAPSAYHLTSLVHVQGPSYITPLVVVGIVSAVLGSSTVAFATRCADHALWLNHLNPIDASGAARKPVSIRETARLAGWTVSALDRLKYVFVGRSYPLKLSGILLFASTVAVGPVLLAGISQTDQVSIRQSTAPNSVDVWTPWITLGNSRSRGGSANDIPILSAALASNQNLSLPVAPVCPDDTCSVTTRSAALFAQCNPSTLPNPGKSMGNPHCESTNPSDWTTNYCSDIVPSLCANLTCGSPSIFANFITGPDPSCAKTAGSGTSSSTPSTCNTIPGTWATIFGVWVGGADSGASSKGDLSTINTVSCTLSYGNVTLSQRGTSPPTIDRSTFAKSTHLLSEYTSPISNVRFFIWQEGVTSTPYYFTLRTTGRGWNNIYQVAVAEGLLGENASNDAEYVARQIEKNFDWATLAAFAKRPEASEITRTTRTVERVYAYDRRLLGILAVPLVATVLAAWGRLRVGSDEEVLGYDPVAIVRRGLAGGDLVVGEYEK